MADSYLSESELDEIRGAGEIVGRSLIYLVDELFQLRAENKELKRQEAIVELNSPDWMGMIGRLAFENEKLRQRIAELEKE